MAIRVSVLPSEVPPQTCTFSRRFCTIVRNFVPDFTTSLCLQLRLMYVRPDPDEPKVRRKVFRKTYARSRTFRANLHHLLQYKGTLAEAAVKLDIPEWLLRRWSAKGTSYAHPKTLPYLEKVATALGVTVEQLWSGEVKPEFVSDRVQELAAVIQDQVGRFDRDQKERIRVILADMCRSWSRS